MILWDKVNKRSGVFGESGLYESECWLWTGSTDSHGYAQTRIDKKLVLVHRYLYEKTYNIKLIFNVIDHLCRIHRCVRPDHLESVSNKENILRGDGLAAHNARKTHCKNGHAFNEENTYLYPYRNGFRRVCKICHGLKSDYAGGVNNKDKTYCKNGHEFTEENTYRVRNERVCKICAKNRTKKYRSQL